MDTIETALSEYRTRQQKMRRITIAALAIVMIIEIVGVVAVLMLVK